MGRRRLTDEEREERRLAKNAAERERLQNDPEFRRRAVERGRQWRLANPEKALAQSRRAEAGRIRDPEKTRQQNAAYYQRNKQKHNLQSKAYYIANHERQLAIQKAAYDARTPEERAARSAQDSRRYLAFRDRYVAKAKEYRLAHKDTPEYHKMKRAWQRNNLTKVRASKNKWKRANLDKLADAAQRRRVRILGGPVEIIDRRTVWERDGGTCYLCDTPANPADWHVDHVIPVAKGGPHTYENVRVTHPDCNHRKGDRLVLPGAYRENIV